MWVNGPIIVGAGPSGLSVAACLTEQNVPYIILERANCIASLWQNKTYNRLKLHLPKKFCELPLFPFPDNYPEYPTKNQFIEYLELYANHFNIKPLFNETVKSAKFDEGLRLWRVKTLEVEYISQWLVGAAGENAEFVIPEFDGLEGFKGGVSHVCEYKDGELYRGKRVLVVGCGNSGMEISLDLCEHGAYPLMVVRDSVHVLPREIFGKSTFEIGVLLMRCLPVQLVDKFILFLTFLVLGRTDKLGLKRPIKGPFELKKTQGKTPVLDVGTLKRIRNGEIKIVPSIKRFCEKSVELVDGRVVPVDTVVFATGYRTNILDWLQEPMQNAHEENLGLYVVGYTRRGLSGCTSDAIRVSQDICKEWRKQALNPAHVLEKHAQCTAEKE
ncbi:hypothetical protein LUZ60_002356 [Juncus effusus]|nr:hypothetical protein LUZ60_002356 [Juncus effusus]